MNWVPWSTATRSDELGDAQSPPPKKKRKAIDTDKLPHGQIKMHERYMTFRSYLLDALASVQSLIKQAPPLESDIPTYQPEPRFDFLEMSNFAKSMNRFKFSDDPVIDFPIHVLDSGVTLDLPDAFDTLVNNPSLKSVAITISPAPSRFIIPPLSKFSISDLSKWRAFRPPDKMDFILMDPPWTNASARRSASYSSSTTFNPRNLLHLNVPAWLTDTGRVAVWCTNSEKLREFILTSLFPFWGLELAEIWLWVKISIHGAVVSDLESTHRKPYEPLFIAKRRLVTLPDSSYPQNTAPAPQRYLFATPSAHSRKPFLKPLLHKILAPPSPSSPNVYSPSSLFSSPPPSVPVPMPKCLELFARNLESNWTSLGNETLKFAEDEPEIK